MSRRLTGSLLAIGLLGSFGIFALTSMARADWTPAETNAEEETPAPKTTTSTTTSPSRVLPTVESIEFLVEKGKVLEAESAYLEWSNAWQEEDEELFIKVETAVLESEHKGGDATAFLALLRAGDATALQQFRDGKVELDAENKLAAIRAVGAHGGPADVPNIIKLLKDTDPAVVGAAIQTLGNIGSARCLPDLYACAATANLENSILIGKTMTKIGASKQLKERYTSQIIYPFYFVSKRACMILAVGGVNANWKFMKSVLDVKKDTTPDDNPNRYEDAHPVKFYPLMLSVLGNLKGEEVASYVQAGLQGSDEEKLAALQSITALPADKIDSTLKAIILKVDPDEKEATELTLNEDMPAQIRLAAIEMLGDRYTDDAAALLRRLASSIKLSDADTVAAAILAAEKSGLLSDEEFRTALHVQLMRDEPKVVRAARTALLANALSGE